jgi:hypothetical protein
MALLEPSRSKADVPRATGGIGVTSGPKPSLVLAAAKDRSEPYVDVVFSIKGRGVFRQHTSRTA